MTTYFFSGALFFGIGIALKYYRFSKMAGKSISISIYILSMSADCLFGERLSPDLSLRVRTKAISNKKNIQKRCLDVALCHMH